MLHRNNPVIKFLFICAAVVCFFVSCSRSSPENETANGALPAAVIMTGKVPLWFQLTEEGAVLLDTIEDAVNKTALTPWTLAPNAGLIREKEGSVYLAVNRFGFIKFTPYNDGIAIYGFPGGDLWRRYSIGGFVFHNNNPVALLYSDDRFQNSAAPLPVSRTWSFSMESNLPFTVNFRALDMFPANEGWNVDTLRSGHDGLIYFRAVNRSGTEPQIRMLRTANLSDTGNNISAEAFFNSSPVKNTVFHSSLPPLPKGFVYTGIAKIKDSLFVTWEEKAGYSIGAAGFMLVSININQ